MVLARLIPCNAGVVSLAWCSRHLANNLRVSSLPVLVPQLLTIQVWVLQHLTLVVCQLEYVLQQSPTKFLRRAWHLREQFKFMNDALYLLDGILMTFVRFHLLDGILMTFMRFHLRLAIKYTAVSTDTVVVCRAGPLGHKLS